jgi:nucleotide-binding universal stress UspA family protein
MYHRIMVPLDGSAYGERALPMAVSLARKSGGWLHLACCAGVGGIPDDAASAQQMREAEEARAYLASVADWVGQQGVDAATSVPGKPPVESLALEVRLHGIDLIVMCTHGHSGLGRWIYGSVAEGMVGCGVAPVLLVRPTGPLAFMGPEPEHAGLLVPLDGSPFAEAALPHAVRLAQTFGGVITLVRAVVSIELQTRGSDLSGFVTKGIEASHDEELSQAKDYLAAVADRLASEGVQVRTVVGENWPVDVIVREGLRAHTRLVVMATHGKVGMLNWMMGRTTMEVIHRSLLPVLLIRPEGGMG